MGSKLHVRNEGSKGGSGQSRVLDALSYMNIVST